MKSLDKQQKKVIKEEKEKELIRQYENETGQHPFYIDKITSKNKKTKEFIKWLEKERKYNTPYKKAVLNAYKKYKDNIIKDTRFSDDKKKVYLALNKITRKALIDGTHSHLFKFSTGVGKSYIWYYYAIELTKTINNIDGFVILSSEYEHGADNVDDQLKELNFRNYAYLKGKSEVCLEKKSKINNEDDYTIGDCIKYRIPIDDFCNGDCSNRNKCEYYKAKNEVFRKDSNVNSWIGVHQHFNTALPVFLNLRKLNIILIFEEDIENAIKSTSIMNLSLIITHIDFLSKIINEIKIKIDKIKKIKKLTKKNKEDVRKDNKYLKYILKLNNFFLELKNSMLSINHTINYSKLEACIIDLMDYIHNFNNYLNRLNTNLFKKIKNREYHLFKQQFVFINTLIKNYEINLEIGSKWLKNTFLIKEDWFNKGNYLIDILYIDMESLKFLNEHYNIEIIIHNDATGDKDYLETFYGKNDNNNVYIEEHSYLGKDLSEIIYRNVTILQVNIPRRFDKAYDSDNKLSQYPVETLKHEKVIIKMLNNIKYTFKHLPNKLQPILTGSRKLTSKRMFLDPELKEHNPNYVSLKIQKKSLGKLIKDIDKSIEHVTLPVPSTNKFIDYRTNMTIGKPNLPYDPNDKNSEAKRMAIALNRTEDEYREYYTRKTILQYNGRSIRFVENIETLIILFTGFEVYFKEFIKKNKIKYISVNSFQEYQKFIDHYDDFKLLKKYLEKNNTITIKQTMELYQIKYKRARTLLSKMEKYDLIIHKRKDVGGKFVYFLL